jgi:molecular chaperone Hsp33
MAESDTLQRFVFEHAPIRGEIVHLNATFRAIRERRDYPTPVRNLLGELMAAAALLTASVKLDGRLILQMRGDGPVQLLVVECSSERTLRATAQWRGDIPAQTLGGLVGDGQLVITIDPRKGRERYQGIVSLEGRSVSAALERYFQQSEQLETRFWLACDEEQAVGMLLQRLPGEMEDADVWTRAVELGGTLTRDELLRLPVREVLRRLYHEEDLRLFGGAPMSFRCSCSRERVERVLRMLGPDEARGIVEERGAVDVDCEYCGRHYRFDAVDVEQLLAAPASMHPPPQRH